MNFSSQSIGRVLYTAAASAAPVIAFVITLTEFVYKTGKLLGTWVHRTNDQLASYSVMISAGDFRAMYNKLRGITPTPFTHPLYDLQEVLYTQTVKELRRGIKAGAKLRKADLINLHLNLGV